MLANQIAAGEVVERPASVVKELVENSLDAGADKIEIEIERGGHKRILIRDNGSGISQHELVLALSRHATSKISSLDDLEQIMSMGFRGEALASISSVSRLTLTSRTAGQDAAWQSYAEGRDMQVQIQPAAHPVGTSVDVQDLFFNTPARRKFLRAEKTEFTHIDEWLRRIALARYDVQFSLRHNGKTVRRYPKINQPDDQRKRVAAILGATFASDALDINSHYESMQLQGYLHANRSGELDVQYFYVNGRVMRDKLIHHAVRQATAEMYGDNHQLAYVMYLRLPPQEVDINVHPAKHEVRFHQARQVHDFIYRAIIDMLQQESCLNSEPAVREMTLPQLNHSYITPIREQSVASYGGASSSASPSAPIRSQSTPAAKASQYQALLQSAGKGYAEMDWMLANGDTLLVTLPELRQCSAWTLLTMYHQHLIATNELTSQPLLMPLSIGLTDVQWTVAQQHSELLKQQGVHFLLHEQRLILRQVPAYLRQLDWATAIDALLQAPGDSLPSSLQQARVSISKSLLVPVWHWAQRHFDVQWPAKLRELSKPVHLAEHD